MRENNDNNNLFFVCSLIEYIARITDNTKQEIISKIGKDKITRIYNLADIYHSEFLIKYPMN